ncbi:MAG: hypothetical protein ACQGVK_08505 [Myxococcota bacterium]
MKAGERVLHRVVPSVKPSDQTPTQVRREFEKRLADGAKIICPGTARKRPRTLLSRGYGPKHRVELFDCTFYLSDPHQNDYIRFYVAYVVKDEGGASRKRIHTHLFYKDNSLTWRSASHFVVTDGDYWIGKGDLRWVEEDGELLPYSDESTTDLPLEMQTALEEICRRPNEIPFDEKAIGLVLRHGPKDRTEPYADFTGPRDRAQANPRNLIHGDRPVARFTRRGDPSSLKIVKGYEPDFANGVVERAHTTSKLYGGKLRRFRIVSTNRKIQYLFIAGPRQVWIASCQATTTDLSHFGSRTIDVRVDDDLLVPAFEYHFMDDSLDPPELFSQIPAGYAGDPAPGDESRADASPWLEKLPVIQAFRRRVLRRSRRR